MFTEDEIKNMMDVGEKIVQDFANAVKDVKDDEGARRLIEQAAQTYSKNIRGSVVRVYRNDGGWWAWSADGIEMFDCKFIGK